MHSHGNKKVGVSDIAQLVAVVFHHLEDVVHLVGLRRRERYKGLLSDVEQSHTRNVKATVVDKKKPTQAESGLHNN